MSEQNNSMYEDTADKQRPAPIGGSASRALYDYFAIFGGRLGGTFMSAAVVTLVARMLGPENYGKFSVFLMVANLIAVVFLNWPNSAVVRFGREEFVRDGRISKVMGSALAILAVTFSASLLLTVIFRGRISGYLGAGTLAVPLLILFVFSSALYDLSFYALQAADKMKIYGFMPVLEKCAALVGLLALVLAGSRETRWVIMVYMAGQFIVAAVTLLSLKRKIYFPLKFELDGIIKILRYAWSIALGAVSAFLMNWADVIAIKKYFPISDVGLYSIGYRGMNIFSMFIMATISVSVPMMVTFRATGRKDMISRYIDELIPQGVFLWSLFVSAVIFVAPMVIPVVLGGAYAPVSPIFGVLMMGAAFISLGCFYSGFTASHDIVPPIVGITVFMSVLKVAGNAFFVPRYGIIAAAYVTVAVFLAGNIMYVPIVNRSGKIEPSARRYMAMFWTAPAITSYLISRLPVSAAWRAVLFIASVAVYFSLAKKAKMFKPGTAAIIEGIAMPEVAKKRLLRVYASLAG